MITRSVLPAFIFLGFVLTSRTQDQTFRAGVDVVSIDVGVTRRNTPVAGLKSQDFDLLDNGLIQSITSVAIANVPVDVSLVFDQGFGSAIDFAGKFSSYPHEIAAKLRPEDRLQVISAGTNVRQVVPMQSPAEIGGRDFSAIDQSSRLDNRHVLDFVRDPDTRPSVFDALLLAFAWPKQADRRHLVVLFSSGADKGSVLDVATVDPLAQRTEAVLHTVLWNQRIMGQYVAGGLPVQLSYNALMSAARATGGDVHYSTSGIGAFKAIFDDFRQGYVLTYTLKGVPPGGWHAVVVKTPGRPEYTVHARPGYLGR
jgi:VWFA-related protein